MVFDIVDLLRINVVEKYKHMTFFLWAINIFVHDKKYQLKLNKYIIDCSILSKIR
jgi:hypothetical protein